MSDLVKALRSEGNLRVAEKEMIFGDWKTRDARIADDLCHKAADEIERLEKKIETYVRLVDYDTKAMEKHWDELSSLRRKTWLDAAELVDERRELLNKQLVVLDITREDAVYDFIAAALRAKAEETQG